MSFNRLVFLSVPTLLSFVIVNAAWAGGGGDRPPQPASPGSSSGASSASSSSSAAQAGAGATADLTNLNSNQLQQLQQSFLNNQVTLTPTQTTQLLNNPNISPSFKNQLQNVGNSSNSNVVSPTIAPTNTNKFAPTNTASPTNTVSPTNTNKFAPTNAVNTAATNNGLNNGISIGGQSFWWFNPAEVPAVPVTPGLFVFKGYSGDYVQCPTPAHGGAISIYVAAGSWNNTSDKLSSFCEGLTAYIKQQSEIAGVGSLLPALTPEERFYAAHQAVGFLFKQLGQPYNFIPAPQQQQLPPIPRSYIFVPQPPEQGGGSDTGRVRSRD